MVSSLTSLNTIRHQHIAIDSEPVSLDSRKIGFTVSVIQKAVLSLAIT
jgi:hypothetical protein